MEVAEDRYRATGQHRYLSYHGQMTDQRDHCHHGRSVGKALIATHLALIVTTAETLDIMMTDHKQLRLLRFSDLRPLHHPNIRHQTRPKQFISPYQYEKKIIILFQVVYYQQTYYGTRENQNLERDFGRPPTGRGVRQDRFPSNFDSLPPRLRKKYEEERSMSEHALKNSHPNDGWDGGSVTFASASRVPHSQSFPAARNKIANKSGRAIVGAKASHYFQEPEDSDVSVPRPRSQDSVDRERKLSLNDSRSSTPSSSLEFQSCMKGKKRS